jgi:hypothetical protein
MEIGIHFVVENIWSISVIEENFGGFNVLKTVWRQFFYFYEELLLPVLKNKIRRISVPSLVPHMNVTENLGMSPIFQKINSKFSSSFSLENQTQF